MWFQVNIKSLEDVIRKYLQLAESQTEAAREESHQAVIDVDDLDVIATPEKYVIVVYPTQNHIIRVYFSF